MPALGKLPSPRIKLAEGSTKYNDYSVDIKKVEMDSAMISTNVRLMEVHVLTDARISMADSLVVVKMDHSKLETGESSQIQSVLTIRKNLAVNIIGYFSHCVSAQNGFQQFVPLRYSPGYNQVKY